MSLATSETPVIASNTLERINVRSSDNPAVRWNASFVLYGGHGTTQSSTIVYEIEPGGELGWHTDATEETQYIVAGQGEFQTEDGVFPVGPGTVFAIPTPVRHNLKNTGSEPLRAVAFFAAAMFMEPTVARSTEQHAPISTSSSITTLPARGIL
jgi:quercetin dioxygenase-like cupin family protein